MKKTAEQFFQQSGDVLKSLAPTMAEQCFRLAGTLAKALGSERKILVFGNGGSASDAQHFAGEMVGRFLMERPGLPAICLSADSSVMTALGNDYGFDEVFARQIAALGKSEDVAFGLSTSGDSPNVVRALTKAKQQGLVTVALTGPGPNKSTQVADFSLCVDSSCTPMIQQAHITIIHLLCLLIEKMLFENNDDS